MITTELRLAKLIHRRQFSFTHPLVCNWERSCGSTALSDEIARFYKRCGTIRLIWWVFWIVVVLAFGLVGALWFTNHRIAAMAFMALFCFFGAINFLVAIGFEGLKAHGYETLARFAEDIHFLEKAFERPMTNLIMEPIPKLCLLAKSHLTTVGGEDLSKALAVFQRLGLTTPVLLLA